MNCWTPTVSTPIQENSPTAPGDVGPTLVQQGPRETQKKMYLHTLHTVHALPHLRVSLRDVCGTPSRPRPSSVIKLSKDLWWFISASPALPHHSFPRAGCRDSPVLCPGVDIRSEMQLFTIPVRMMATFCSISMYAFAQYVPRCDQETIAAKKTGDTGVTRRAPSPPGVDLYAVSIARRTPEQNQGRIQG